ncbi:MAG: WD40/YVTN/BNR-like repeat-containing protein, partial [Nitrososphaerales archaeon]
DLNSGLEITQFQSIAPSPSSGSSAIGGTQDNACVQYSGTSTWNELTAGDGGWSGIESTNPSIMYCDYTHLNVQKSTNGGSAWGPATSGINLGDNSQFYAPVAQDPNNPGTLYIGGTHVYKTTNFATSWIDVSGSIGTSTISAITVAPSNSSVVYLGDSSGDVKVSNNAGSTWTTIATEGLPISSIAINTTNYKIAYVALASYATPSLLKTTNEGASWKTLSLSGFPQTSINVAKINPTGGAIFVGTDSGVFYSSDAGSTWSIMGSGLPNVAVFDIAFTRSDNVLAATHGRGVWQQPSISEALTFSYSVQAGGSGYTPPTLSYVKNGVLTNVTLTTLPLSYSADYGSSWNVSSTLSGSTSAERWKSNQVASGTAGSSQTIVFQYYHQYNVTASYSVSDGGAPSAPTLSRTKFGVLTMSPLTTTPTTFWIDNGSTWTITNPLSGSTSSERWVTTSSSGTVSSSFSFSPVYYHEFAQVLSYSVIDGGILPSTPTASGTQLGTSYAPTLTTTATPYWFDSSGSITLTSIMSGQTNERWANPASTIPATSAGSNSLNFYHQYSISALYSVVGSGSGYSSPMLAYDANGTLSNLALTTQSQSLWADASSWSITNPLGGSNSTTRWYATGASGRFSQSTTIDPTSYEQFMVEIQSSSQSEGTVSPSGWVNSSSTITIAATPLAGYQFVSWAGEGPASYSGSSPSQQITITSPIIEVANFVQTTSSSSSTTSHTSTQTTASGSSATTQSSSSSQQTQQSNLGGLGSLDLALIAGLVVAVVVVAAVVALRKRG